MAFEPVEPIAFDRRRQATAPPSWSRAAGGKPRIASIASVPRNVGGPGGPGNAGGSCQTSADIDAE